MATDFAAIFAALKPVFATCAPNLAVQTDTPEEYTLVTKSPSPFPQHKGHPMFFGSVKRGKAYVSVHLMPIYMNAALQKQVPPGLKKRMQGKSCFNFKTGPEPESVAELQKLAQAGFEHWRGQKWT